MKRWTQQQTAAAAGLKGGKLQVAKLKAGSWGAVGGRRHYFSISWNTKYESELSEYSSFHTSNQACPGISQIRIQSSNCSRSTALHRVKNVCSDFTDVITPVTCMHTWRGRVGKAVHSMPYSCWCRCLPSLWRSAEVHTGDSFMPDWHHYPSSGLSESKSKWQCWECPTAVHYVKKWPSALIVEPDNKGSAGAVDL